MVEEVSENPVFERRPHIADGAGIAGTGLTSGVSKVSYPEFSYKSPSWAEGHIRSTAAATINIGEPIYDIWSKLALWDQDKMVAILETFSNSFS